MACFSHVPREFPVSELGRTSSPGIPIIRSCTVIEATKLPSRDGWTVAQIVRLSILST